MYIQTQEKTTKQFYKEKISHMEHVCAVPEKVGKLLDSSTPQ